jgi:hypothetical protein
VIEESEELWRPMGVVMGLMGVSALRVSFVVHRFAMMMYPRKVSKIVRSRLGRRSYLRVPLD